MRYIVTVPVDITIDTDLNNWFPPELPQVDDQSEITMVCDTNYRITWDHTIAEVAASRVQALLNLGFPHLHHELTHGEEDDMQLAKSTRLDPRLLGQ